MKITNTFQVVVGIVFGVFAVAGVLFFSLQKSGTEGTANIAIWGTFDVSIFDELIQTVFEINDIVDVTYRQIDREDFDSKLVEALAEGGGPDAILLSQDSLLRHREKIFLIPFESLSERDFRDGFIDGAGVYIDPEGIVGLPFIVDPVVMYWNRAMIANASLVGPPLYWDEFSDIVPKITQRDFTGNILKSTVAFGEFVNVDNAKDILSTLLLQAGNPIIIRTDSGFRNVLSSDFNNSLSSSEAVLRFYTEFADPIKPIYSWNRSLPSSRSAFLSGDLALYFGFASELQGIRRANPNLDFDVAVVPQIRDTNTKTTFANFQAFSILKKSRNITSTIAAISRLSGAQGLLFVTEETDLPPTARGLLRDKPVDPYKSVFYDSALISESWLDPNRVETGKIFSDMIEDVTSGRLRISSSVSRASNLIDILLKEL